MKLFQLYPKALAHLTCKSPRFPEKPTRRALAARSLFSVLRGAPAPLRYEEKRRVTRRVAHAEPPQIEPPRHLPRQTQGQPPLLIHLKRPQHPRSATPATHPHKRLRHHADSPLVPPERLRTREGQFTGHPPPEIAAPHGIGIDQVRLCRPPGSPRPDMLFNRLSHHHLSSY